MEEIPDVSWRDASMHANAGSDLILRTSCFLFWSLAWGFPQFFFAMWHASLVV